MNVRVLQNNFEINLQILIRIYNCREGEFYSKYISNEKIYRRISSEMIKKGLQGLTLS